MRVLFIHNQYQQAGGEDVAVALEANLLRERGHEVRSIIFQNKNPSGVLDKINKGWKAIYNLHSYRLVKNELEKFKPDLIHVHNLFFEASPSVLYAAGRHKIPVVITLHNYRLICANALLLRDGNICELCTRKTFPLSGIRYKCYRNSRAESALVTSITALHRLTGTWNHRIKKFIVLTEFARSRFIGSSMDAVKDKLIVKPNFIPDPGLGNEKREDFFLFVGRLSSEKGIHILLNTFSKLRGQHLVVIGEGPEREAAMARFMDVTNISFTGKLEKSEVLSYLKKCKALIFPSTWYEGLPFVIIEAFATGTPVIASRLGSMTELVEHEFNGLLFEPKNEMDLLVKINLFLQRAGDERKQLYENARTTYLAKYHPGIHYQTILSIYETVIAEK